MSWTAERMESVVRALAEQVGYSSPSCGSCRESMHESCNGTAWDREREKTVACRCFLSWTHDRPLNAAEDEEAEETFTCAGCGKRALESAAQGWRHNPEDGGRWCPTCVRDDPDAGVYLCSEEEAAAAQAAEDAVLAEHPVPDGSQEGPVAETVGDESQTCAGCGVHNPEGHAYVIVGGDAKDILGITEVGRLPLCQGCDCRISSGFADPRRALMDAFDLVVDLQNLSRHAVGMTMEEITSLDARVEEMRRRVEYITGEQR